MRALHLALVSGSSCDANPNGSNCSPDSIGAVVGAIVIVAVIVALVIFNWWWKRGNPDSNSPPMRLFLAVVRRLGPRSRR